MLQKKKSTSGGGAQKIGKSKKKCERYKNQGKREKNKVRKVLRHLKNHPEDQCAHDAVKRLDPSQARPR